ncbi:osteopontin isoform X1 [Melanotaenia boesemani]|uniref:osteopontin isoform X1 n=1 Tax=Melanotaenia boesemani TaxID=1250792 RepID=UPI001C042AD2|nr:osteopontin isoform X1 [Melanotaenia boesemani]XP_041825108.1 osteopontin isoform X1 [Melanotaenia boesemani]
MKVAVVFVLLFATVLCRPARKGSDSSSDSSEEVVRRPAAPVIRRQQLVVPKHRVAPPPVQPVVTAAAVNSDESTETSEEEEEVAAAESPVEVKADGTKLVPTTDTASVDSKDSDDDDDDDDDETEESETEEEEDNSTDSSESGESSTPAPVTVNPVVVTDEPIAETTIDTILPTIVTDTDGGRGDSLGGYPSDYKSIVYVEEKSYHKIPGPYKSYEFVGTGKKVAYDMTDGNEVEKSPKVYKVQAFQIQSDPLEEDTSTPEVETQGLDTSSGSSHDQDISARQASLPEEQEESTSTSEATTSESESSSTPEEDEDNASTNSDSASASEESEDEESQSSEEPTATPGAADSDSDESDSAESDSDEEGAALDTTTDMPVVITAK